MRILSALSGFLLLAIAVIFALSNRQEASIGLWPFIDQWAAPLYLLILLSLLAGLIIGGLFAWLAMLPHQMTARRLRGDIGSLHAKLDTLQQALTPDDAASATTSSTAALIRKKRWSWRGPAV